MDEIQKFLRNKVDRKLREQLLQAMRAIRTGIGIELLDIKALQGRAGWYRCRVRSVRIVYYRDAFGKNILHAVDFRKDAYKK